MPRCVALLLCASVLLLGLLTSGLADARGKKKSGKVKFDANWAKHPSAQYAALSGPQCLAELNRRGIEHASVDRAPGVLAPVRLPKDVGGVMYRTEVAPQRRAQNPFDVFDCRLVLALADWSALLRARDIDEVLMYSAWRPPSAKWPEGKLGTRHPGALAIDAYRFGKKLAEGQKEKERVWLDVDRDFFGTLGAPPCGAGSAPRRGAPAAAGELRAIACEAAEKHLFTSILTPNYNRAHKNHFHLEVTPDVAWHLMR